MNYCKVLLILLTGILAIGRAEGRVVVKADSRIDQVTVFPEGAQVVRSARVQIPAGTTELVFDGVSPHVNHASLQAGGRGDFVVMSVRYHTEHTPPGTKKKDAVPATLLRQIAGLRDSLEVIQFELEGIGMRLAAWNTEKSMLERNRIITGKGKGDSLLLFMQAMDFYRTKIHEINDQILTIRREQRRMEQQRQGMQHRLHELVRYQQQLERESITPAAYSYQVIVTVSAEAATRGVVTINYLVSNASWVPSYELRAHNSSEPVSLQYRAMITQNTGEDWQDVQLTLSTVTPQPQRARPRLSAWVLRYAQPRGTVIAAQSNVAMDVEVATMAENSSPRVRHQHLDKSKPAPSLSAFTQQNTHFSNIEFEISMRYTIPSDGKAHRVSILEEEVDAQFRHYAVPKMERESYLMAQLTGWERLSLLPGTANIYFMNTIIGSTPIDPLTASDTLEIGLGLDQGVTVARKKIADREVNRMLSSNTEREIIMEITVRNRKGEPVNLQLSDQIPVSGDENISIKHTQANLSGATLNERTGELLWNIQLKPMETRVITFTYTITHPRDRPLPVM